MNERSRMWGRERELAALGEALRDRPDGIGGAVLIEGEAGIGKTMMLRTFVELAGSNGWQTIAPRCSETDQIRQFGALLDVLGCRMQHTDPLRRRVAETIVAAVNPVIDPFRLDMDATWRLPVQEAIADVILDMVDRGPTLIAVDDVQWADAGTAGVLLALARHTRTSPLLIAWAQRPDVGRGATVQLRSKFSDHLLTLRLDPLDASSMVDLGADILGKAPNELQLSRLQAAGGNPFFVNAILALDVGTDRAEALQRWVERLPVPTGHALSTAALLGREFDLPVLAAVIRRTPHELIEILEPALGVGLLGRTGPGRYTFGHDLIRDSFATGYAGTLLVGRSHKSLSPAREVYLALALANADEHDEAAIWFAKGQRDANAVSDLWLVSRYQLARMSSEVLTGDWDSVVADAEAVIALHDDTGMGSGMSQAPSAAGLVAVRRGASNEVVSRYREIAARHNGVGAELPGLLFHAWFDGLVAERE